MKLLFAFLQNSEISHCERSEESYFFLQATKDYSIASLPTLTLFLLSCETKNCCWARNGLQANSAFIIAEISTMMKKFDAFVGMLAKFGIV